MTNKGQQTKNTGPNHTHRSRGYKTCERSLHEKPHMRSSRLGVLGLVLLLALCPLCTMASRTALLPAARCAAMKAAVTEPLRHDDTLDTPGILWMEHLNLIVGERSCAEAFYIDFLGFAAEPGSSFHVNLGSQQFHLKDAAEAHLLTGTVGLAVPSLDALRERHSAARAALQDTKFDVADHGDCMAVVCPWGNSFACYEAKRELPSGSGDLPKMVAAQVGMDESMAVRGAPGIRFTSFRVRPGTAPRVGLFYETIFGCKVSYGDDGRSATVSVGPSVHLIFEDDEARPLTDDEERRQAGPGGGVGLHVCIYIANFKATYDRLDALGLVWTNPRFRHLDTCDTYEEAVASRGLRFKTIIDVETKEPLLELEHEVRAQRHFQYFKKVKYP